MKTSIYNLNLDLKQHNDLRKIIAYLFRCTLREGKDNVFRTFDQICQGTELEQARVRELTLTVFPGLFNHWESKEKEVAYLRHTVGLSLYIGVINDILNACGLSRDYVSED